ncbi:MAG: hypothetical protein IIB22_01450 [Chloroflexi bacterium]|nr:hypothetical protein [Chloroflexota bacterium]
MVETRRQSLWRTPPAIIAVLLMIIGVCLLLTSQASAAPSAGGTPTISVSTIQVGVGGQGTAELVVSGVPSAGIGSWTVDVSYNSGVVSVADCTGLLGGVCNANLGPSLMRVVGATAGGIFTTSTLATITFTCNALGTSVTGLSVSLLADTDISDPQEYSPIVINGSVVCVELPDTPTPVPADTPIPRQRTDTPVPRRATDTPAPGEPADTPVPGQPTNTPAPGETPDDSEPTPATGTPEGTPDATPSPTLTSEVLGVTTPGASSGDGAAPDNVRQPPAADAAAAVRPDTTSAVMRMGDVSTDPRVIATNIILAIILLCILLGASALFNDTIDLNRDELERRLDWFMTPFHMIGAGINWVAGTIHIPERVQRILAPMGILLLIGAVYSFNEPVGFDERGLLLFLSLIISIGVLTYIFEGGMAIMSRDRYHVPSGVKIFPLAILIALGFVLISRIVNFEAPIMFGFVAVATALAVSRLSDEQEAATAAIPTAILLIAALIAWALIGPLRDAASDSSAWYASLPSETAALIFAGGVEGVLFAMIPVQFSDGYPIWRSLRWVWLGLSLTAAFVFSWVILNPAATEFDALIEGRVLTAIGLVSAYAIVVIAIWAYFSFRSRSGTAQPVAAD